MPKNKDVNRFFLNYWLGVAYVKHWLRNEILKKFKTWLSLYKPVSFPKLRLEMEFPATFTNDSELNIYYDLSVINVSIANYVV